MQVTAPDGSSSVYQYDAAGNIVSIQNIPANQLAPVITLSSVDGAPGAQITISGGGFSTNCSADAVSFNGVAATVVSCTADQLVVQVPSGATSGTVSVTVGGQVVTSSQAFNVVPAPTVSAFSPALTNVGATVTVSGTNLDPVAGGTSVSVSGTGVDPTSVTATQLTFAAQASGTITVTTPNGVANSATELLVLPQSISAANVISSAALTQNGPAQSLTVNQASKFGLFSFDGTQGQFLSLQLSALAPSATAISYQLFSPTCQQIATGTVSTSGNMSIHLPQIPITGPYLLVFASGTATAQLTAALGVDATLSLTGTGQSGTTSVAWQSERFVWSAVAGGSFGLGLTSLAASPTSPANVYPYVYRPDGSTLASPTCPTTSPGGGCSLPSRNLTESGPYTLVMYPAGAQTLSFNVAASQPVSGALIPGTPQSLNLSIAGQYALLTFTATAGQTVALSFDSVATLPANQIVAVTVYNASGTQVGNTTSSTAATINLTNLAAGTYTVQVLPNYAATATLQVYLAPTDALTSGTTTSDSTAVAGEAQTFTFSGTAAQNLGLGITNLVVSPSTPADAYPYIYKPDGTLLTDPTCYSSSPGGGCTIQMKNLPQTGTYTLLMDPQAQQTMSFNVSVSQAVTGTLTAGTPQSLNLSVPGQYALLTFTATAGQTVALSFDSVVTLPANQMVAVTVYNSSGTQVGTTTSSTAATINLTNLAAGTYTVQVLPSYAATASLQVYLSPTDALASGTTTNDSTAVAGEAATFTFSGTAGQNLGLGITNLVVSPSTPADAYPYIYKPDGTLLTDPTCYSSSPGGGCTISMKNLPQTGTYTLLIDPQAQQTMSFNVSVSQAETGTLTAGTPQSLNLSVPGQYALLNFTATAGQTVALSFDSVATLPANQPVTVTVYNSSGTQINSAGSSTAATLNLTDLAAGTYTVQVLPSYAATATLQVYLSPTDALTSGTTTNDSTAVAGEAATFTFSGTAGQNLGVGITNLVVSPGSPNYASPWIYAPNGAVLPTPYCYTSNPGGGCTIQMKNLSQTGTYTLLMDPQAQQTMSFNVSVSQAVTGTLTAGTPQSLNLSVPGQYALLSFTATAGQTVALSFDSVTTLPANQPVTVTVYNSSGTQINSAGSSTAATLNLTDLAAGTYTVQVLPSYAATATLQVYLSPTDALTLSATANYSTAVAGEGATFTFSGTAGQYLGVGVTSLALAPSSPNYASPWIYAPNGAVLPTPYCYTSSPGGGCTMPLKNLSQTGTYTLLMDPQAQQTMSFNVAVSPAVTGTLTSGNPQNLNLSVPGQYAALNFTATSGQSVALTYGSITTSPANQSITVTVYNSSGSQVGTSSSATGATLSLTNLAAGTYTVVVLPSYAATANVQVSIQ